MKSIPMPYRRTPEVAAYEDAMQQGLQTICVSPRPNGWIVKRPLDKSGRLFASRSEAILYAKERAEQKGVRMFVFKKSWLPK